MAIEWNINTKKLKAVWAFLFNIHEMEKLYRCGKRQIASEDKDKNIETKVENKP